jgi:hypothetical protein
MDSTYVICLVVLVIVMVVFFAIRFCPNDENEEEDDLVQE